MEQNQQNVDIQRALLAERFNEASEKKSAQPAPQRSLHLPAMGGVVADIFSRNNTLFFGEIHDDVNYKFLADNPDIFRQAKIQNVTKMFLELPSAFAPLYKAYFDGKVSENKFKKEIIELNKTILFTSGDTPEEMGKQMAAMAIVAKSSGVQLLPSDFRDITSSSFTKNHTSAVFGIPDIQKIEDSVSYQTSLSLAAYKKKFSAKTGFDLPVTAEQIHDFQLLHYARIKALDEGNSQQFKKDLAARQELAYKDKSRGNITYQNEMQSTYYSMIVKPNEKTMFMGGSAHASSFENIGDMLAANGYGTTGSIMLKSETALLLDQGRDVLGLETRNGALYKPYDYVVHTESGEITKFDGTKFPPRNPTIKSSTTASENRDNEVQSLNTPLLSLEPAF